MRAVMAEETLSTPEKDPGSAATWIAGGLLVAAAITVYALDKKGPEPLRYRRA